MNPTLKNVIKTGLLFAAVGAALGLVAPVIGMAVGIVGGATTYGAAAAALGHSANALWMGAFFGSFGAIDAAVRPVFDKMFGDDKAKAASGNAKVTIILNPAKEKAPEQEMTTAKYRETIEAERTAIKAEKTVTI